MISTTAAYIAQLPHLHVAPAPRCTMASKVAPPPPPKPLQSTVRLCKTAFNARNNSHLRKRYIRRHYRLSTNLI